MDWLFDSTSWVPRGQCGDWQGGLDFWFVAFNLGIAAAYLAIPAGLIDVWVAKRDKLVKPLVLVLFALFIVLCGMTHVLSALAFWWPAYRFSVLVDGLTMLASAGTAVYGWYVGEHVKRWKTPDEYATVIAELHAEKVVNAALHAEREAAYQTMRQELHDARNKLASIQWKAEAAEGIDTLRETLANIHATVRTLHEGKP